VYIFATVHRILVINSALERSRQGLSSNILFFRLSLDIHRVTNVQSWPIFGPSVTHLFPSSQRDFWLRPFISCYWSSEVDGGAPPWFSNHVMVTQADNMLLLQWLEAATHLGSGCNCI